MSGLTKIISLRRRIFVTAGLWLVWVVVPAGFVGFSVALAIELGFSWRSLLLSGPLFVLGTCALLLFRPVATGSAEYLALTDNTITLKLQGKPQFVEWKDVASIDIREESARGIANRFILISLKSTSGIPYPWFRIPDAYTTPLAEIEDELKLWMTASSKPGSSTKKNSSIVTEVIERDQKSLVRFAFAWALLGPGLALLTVVAIISRRYLL